MVQRAQRMGALTDTLANALPESFGGSIVAANVRDDGELIVIARSSAWAARLRFETVTLETAARETGAAVTRCTVRVTHDS